MQNVIDSHKNHIAAKMVLVSIDMKYVQKTGFNSYHKYNYVMASDVMKRANESLTKNRVATVVTHEVISIDTITNQKGNQEKLATVKATVTFIDSDSGQYITSSGLGSGQDGGDKAIMKAETAALKYVYTQCFNIETGDKSEDPEFDVSVDERMGAKPQKAALKTAPVQQPNSGVNLEDEKSSQRPPSNPSDYVCQGKNCEKTLNENTYSYSMRNYHKPLCYECQQKVKGGNGVIANPAHDYQEVGRSYPQDDDSEVPF